MKYAIFVLLFLLVMTSSAFAITIDEAVSMALDQSESMRIVEETSTITRAEGSRAVAFTLPQVDLEARYLRTKAETDIIFFETPEWTRSWTAQASQVLFAGGKIWNSWKLRNSLYNLSDTGRKAGRRDIISGVKVSFYKVLLQREQLKIFRDRIGQRREELEDAQDLLDAGMVTPLDVRQAQLSLNNAVDQLKEGEVEYNNALVDFNVLLGKPGSGDLLIPDGDLGRAAGLSDTISLLENALQEETLIDIQLAKQDQTVSRMKYRIANGDYLPTLALIGYAQSSNETFGETVDIYAVGFQLSWNILNGGLSTANRASALSELHVRENRLEKGKKELAGTVNTIKETASSLNERIALQEESVVLSEKNYEDSREHYRAGTITQTRLGEFNLSFALARFNLIRLYYFENELHIRARSLLEEK